MSDYRPPSPNRGPASKRRRFLASSTSREKPRPAAASWPRRWWRYTAILAAVGAVALAVTACGGGSGNAPAFPADWKPYRGPVPILEYHPIQAPVKGMDRHLFVPQADFQRQMKWLDDHGYEAVTLDQVENAWYKRGKLPPKPIVVSFDDGYLSQYVAGFLVLQTFHWPGVMNLHLSSDLPDQDVKKMVAAG